MKNEKTAKPRKSTAETTAETTKSTLVLNTHNHIDYGGDDAEHSTNPSKSYTEAERKMRSLMYRGD